MSSAKVEKAPLPKGEVKVNRKTFLGTYLAYIAKEFESGQDPIILKATGQAIGKAMGLAKLCMHRFKGLSQLTESGEIELPAFKKPPTKEKADEKRKVQLVSITLSKKPLDKNNKGYVPPVPESEVQTYVAKEKKEIPKVETKPRGRFRRFRGRGFGMRRGRGYFGQRYF